MLRRGACPPRRSQPTIPAGPECLPLPGRSRSMRLQMILQRRTQWACSAGRQLCQVSARRILPFAGVVPIGFAGWIEEEFIQNTGHFEWSESRGFPDDRSDSDICVGSGIQSHENVGEGATPCSITHRESQRDSVPQPRVARNELPWVNIISIASTATRLWPIHIRTRAGHWPQRRWRCFNCERTLWASGLTPCFTSKAPSPLRSAGAVHDETILDCGGKRSATPLWHHQSDDTSKSSGTLNRSVLKR